MRSIQTTRNTGWSSRRCRLLSGDRSSCITSLVILRQAKFSCLTGGTTILARGINPSWSRLMYDAVVKFLEPTYDSNGNTLTSVTGSNTTTYAWDFENQLSSVTLPGSGGTVSFKYDPFGRRVYKSSSSGTSIYAYDGDNLVEETNASGAAVARYAQNLNIDQPLAILRNGATSFYNADALGSITSLANGAGSLAQTYSYDSFGKSVSSSGSVTNPFQYTARELDPETNLYYYRARHYDTASGRFIG